MLMIMKEYWVYILASHKHGTLYIGVTNDLARRLAEHQTNQNNGFTSRYGVKTLVYFESCYSAEDAILREKQLKGWRRQYKIELIEKDNSQWRDLSEEWGL